MGGIVFFPFICHTPHKEKHRVASEVGGRDTVIASLLATACHHKAKVIIHHGSGREILILFLHKMYLIWRIGYFFYWFLKKTMLKLAYFG
jgi:hypothetical protein